MKRIYTVTLIAAAGVLAGCTTDRQQDSRGAQPAGTTTLIESVAAPGVMKPPTYLEFPTIGLGDKRKLLVINEGENSVIGVHDPDTGRINIYPATRNGHSISAQ